MDFQTLTSLLEPFLATPLREQQIVQLSTYLDLLLKWNSKMNLTAVREPEEIVARHFGESLFVAEVLSKVTTANASLLDLGSGAGFPGLPIKIALPALHVVLAESQQKKAIFLREVVRSLGLETTEVFPGRAENLNRQFDVVAMRAVDNQESLFELGSRLTTPEGSLLLMSGTSGIDAAKTALPKLTWREPIRIPASSGRWILLGTNPGKS